MDKPSYAIKNQQQLVIDNLVSAATALYVMGHWLLLDKIIIDIKLCCERFDLPVPERLLVLGEEFESDFD